MKKKPITKKELAQRELKLTICDKIWEAVDKIEKKYDCDVEINIEKLKLNNG